MDRDSLESKRSAASTSLSNANGMQMWMWLAFLGAFFALLWGVGSQYMNYLHKNAEDKPFLQVTNRQISLFLWQNPEFMRVNVASKSGYLPAFDYVGKVTMNPRAAEQLAIAPPNVLFRYHTWSRLLKKEYISRPISATEFVEFLESDEAWQPENWPGAPSEYRLMVKGLDPTSKTDIESLPETVLPLDVKIAFQGWKNFQFEGEAIVAVRPTYKEMAAFIRRYPHYARSYWQNITDRGRYQYLKGLNLATDESTETIPSEELSPFLKVAFYNYLMSLENR